MSTSNEEQKNDDFLDALGASEIPVMSEEEKKVQPETIAKSEREKMQQELKNRQIEEKEMKKAEVKPSDDDQMDFESVKPKKVAPPEEKVVEKVEIPKEPEKVVEKVTEPIVSTPKSEIKEEKVETEVNVPEEEKPVEEPKPVVSKPESVIGKVDVLSSEEVEAAESKKKVKKSNVKKDVEISDDLDRKVVEVNDEIDAQAYESNLSDEDREKEYTIDELNKAIDDNYVDEVGGEDKTEVKVDIVSENNKKSDEKKNKFTNKKPTKEIKTPFYGGDGQTTSFKLRSSKVGKILRNVHIDNTEELDPIDVSRKTPTERQDFYLKTVLPTLQPSIAVVPLIISGVVISMTAFGWPDLRAIVEYEDKLNELDPSSMRDDEYIHAKNQLFIEKRRKQCELFYKHITSVTGYVVKPSQEELFGKIIKFPDFPQLFFAAYAASFLKPYEFDIGCPICGANNPKSVVAKDLCFLLNSNIDIKRLNYFIQNGTALGQEETAKVYNEFQKEKIVELSTTKYRIKKNLPISSFVYELSIPTVYEALDAMEEIIETFRDVDLSYTEMVKDGNGEIISTSTVYIDSSFGLTPQLIEMRKYLYMSSLIVPEVIEENKDTKSAKIGFASINDKPAIIQSIYNLSSEDYSTLINDPNLNKLLNVSGIRHAIKGGTCSESTCGADLGFVSAEPETLFFILARHDLRS